MRRILVSALLVLLASMIAVGCGEFGQRYEGDADTKAEAAGSGSGGGERVSDERFTAKVQERDGCTEAEEFDSEGNNHTQDPNEQVEYESNPPHSGDHYQIAKEWGLYGDPQTDEHWVHNLEHGHIAVLHKGLSEEDEATLLKHARKDDYHLIVMPRKANPKDGVYYVAWTAKVHCERPSAAALQYMIDTYRDQGPELFTDDAGGVDMGLDEKS